MPYLNELYFACIGKGSYCNDKKLMVSDANSLVDSLLVTGFSYDRFETEDNNYAEFCYLTHKTCLLYTSPSPRDRTRSRMPSSA